MSKKNTGKYTSLRFILIAWFVVFSIVPLGIVSWYSLLKFRKAIESEQLLRLKANGREIEVIISDYYNQLKSVRQILTDSPQFTYSLAASDAPVLKEIASEWLRNSVMSSISIYNREGIRILQSEKDDKGQISNESRHPHLKTVLDERYRAHLSNKPDIGVVHQDQQSASGLGLLLFSKIVTVSGKTIGYIEQKINLRQQFLYRIKNRLKLDLMLLDNKKQIAFSTLKFDNPNLQMQLVKNVSLEPDIMLDIQNQGHLYGFILYPVLWDKSDFLIAIGTSKDESQMVLRNVNVAFIGVISLVFLFLIVTILISTSVLLKPINELIDGLRAFEKNDSPVQLLVKNKTEIGLLTTTFNQMSLKIFEARNDLKKKIKELEKANSHLKEAQTKLVHSAKMTSLGQLVAGVAHELNNPIGFIYSNTSHLKDYSERLFKIIEEIEKNPQDSEKIKLVNEFDYIKKDLPRLIASCQDGAQRTRDIVIGLRNFSRLEESQLKEIDLRESIDTTLELLKGEINNRIRIHRNYESIPMVFCYASQINQVIMNILTNAVYAIQGNGQIWISTTVIKASAQSQGKVQISIQDSGVGMRPEVLEKIFEPFFTTKDVGQGTGLGLSISYGIIQNHGGDIQVRSENGVGTEFIITIPIAQKPKAK